MSAGSSESYPVGQWGRPELEHARYPDSGRQAEISQPSLLDRILEPTAAQPGPGQARLDQFLELELEEDSLGKALSLWFGSKLRRFAHNKDQLARLLTRDIARLDEMLCWQVNAIIHHPRFQKLEASWRGLLYLATQAEGAENIKIRVLNVSWSDLCKDLDRAPEFDRSQLFRKVYSAEFGMPGGEPFGVLLGDYEIRHKPDDEVRALRAVSQVAAAAFAPFIAGADAAIFGLDSFTELQLPLNLPRTFEQLEYTKWKAFRDSEDARFVGLALPRVLMRLPYEDDNSRVDGFRFREDVEGSDRSKYLWGNACYAFGAVLIRAFEDSGWLADIRGVQRGIEGRGLVTGLPVHSFTTDKTGVAPKSSTEVILTDMQEKELGDLGFIPLCHCWDTDFAAFYGSQSVQKPKTYDKLPATMNARLSTMLHYMLCVSRFAHYLKVVARGKIGALANASELENYLNRWVQGYVTSDDNAAPETKAEYPLREAGVQIRERPGKPGNYICVAHLRPHFQLDQIVAAVRLRTELAPAKTG